MADPIQADVDLSDFIVQINRLTREFAALHKVSESNISQIVVYNKKTEKTALTLSALVSGLGRVTQKTAELSEEIATTSQSIKVGAKAFTDYTLAQLKAEKASGRLTIAGQNELKVREKINAQRRIDAAFKKVSSTVSGDTSRFGDVGQLKKFEAALRTARREIGLNSIAANDFATFVTTSGAKAEAAFNRLSPTVKIAAREMKTAMEGVISTSAAAALEITKTAAAAETLKKADLARSLGKSFSKDITAGTGLSDKNIIKQATPAQIAATEIALKKLNQALAVTGTEFTDAKIAILGGKESLAAFSRLTPETKVRVAALKVALESLSAPARKSAEDVKLLAIESQRLLDLRIKSALSQRLGQRVRGSTNLGDKNVLSGAEPAQIAAAELALKKLTESLGLNATAFKNVQKFIRGGAGAMEAFGKLTPEVQVRVSALRKAIEKLSVPTEKAAAKLLKASTAAEALKASTAFTDRLAAKFQKLNGSANPAQIQKFSQALAGVSEFMRKSGTSAGVMTNTMKKLESGFITTFTAAEAKAIPALKRLQAAMRATGAAGDAAGKSIGLSFNLIGRIIIGNSVSRAFFGLTSQMRESITAAKEFSLAIAEIETLSRNNSVSTEEWSDEVFRLSEEFGKLSSDVAEGVYQTLSNQVAQGAEAITFMETALRLSLATVSSAEDAVNALTGVINAFDLETNEAARVAGQFFKIVEFGRTRLSEMANTMGRVNVIAQQMGVSFEEVGAFVGLTTIAGVKTNEALTQLRNVMLKILRPTDALKERLKGLGFETGIALIEARGFTGVFDLLNQVIREEGTEAVGEMFGRVRAITGAMAAAGEGAADFTDLVKKLTEGADSATDAFDKVNKSIGQRFERQIQQLNNFFVKEFGTKFVRVFVDFTESLGGARNALLLLFSTVKIGTGLFLLASIAIAKNTVATLTATAATHGLTAAQIAQGRAAKAAVRANALLLAGFLAFEGVLLLARIYEEATIESKRYFKSVQDGLKKQLKDFDEQQGFLLNSIRKTVTAASRQWFVGIANIRKELFQLQDELEIRFEEVADSLKESISNASKAAKDFVKEPADAIRDLASQIERTKERIKSLGQKSEGRIFDKSLKDAGDINKQLSLIDKRVTDLRKKSIISAGTGDEDTVIRSFDQIEKLIEKRAKLTADFDEDQKDSIQSINDLRNKLDRLDLDAQKKSLAIKKALRGGTREEQIDRARLSTDLTKILNTQDKIRGKLGEQLGISGKTLKNELRGKDIDELKNELLEERATLLKRINSTRAQGIIDQKKELKAREDDGKRFFDALGKLKNLEKEIKNEFLAGADAVDIQARAIAKVENVQALSVAVLGGDPAAQLQLFKDTEEKKFLIREQFIQKGFAAQAKANEAEAKNIKETILKSLEAGAKLERDLKIATSSQVDRLANIPEKLLAAQATLTRPSSTVPGVGANQSALISEDNEKDIARIKSVIEALSNGTEEAFGQNLITAIKTIRDFTKKQEEFLIEASGQKTLEKVAKRFGPNVTALNLIASESLKVLRDIVEARGAQLDQADVLRTQEELLKKNTEAQVLMVGVTQEHKIALIDTNEIYDTMVPRIEALTQAEVDLREQMKLTSAAATRSIRAGAFVGPPIPASLPRFAHFARGGMARGTDTVPAMLTPGEFVMNRRSTQAFLPTLRAMNAGGIRPKQFQDGGTVEGDSSSVVGDITINAGSANISTKELAHLLKKAAFEKKIRIPRSML